MSDEREPTSEVMARVQASLGTAFMLERELGGGGMSRVFLAHEAGLDRGQFDSARVINRRRCREIRRIAAGAKDRPIVTDRSLIVPYSGQALQVPQGFVAAPYVTGLTNPRRLLVLPNGDVLVAEQSAGYVTLLRDDGEGHVKWIDRHVEDLNKPYGIAWQGDHLLVADQDGIWQVPHIVGAVRPGRPVPAQRADELPPDQRRPVAGAYGAEMVTKKGVFGIVAGTPEPRSEDRPEKRRIVRRRRLVGQSRRRARAEGDDPAV